MSIAAKARIVAQQAELRGDDGLVIANGALVVVAGELPEIIMFEGNVFERRSYGLAIENYRLVRVYRADACFQPARINNGA